MSLFLGPAPVPTMMTMTRRASISRSSGIAGMTIVAVLGLLTAAPVHADEPVEGDPIETPAPEPADDAETAEIDGDTVAVGTPPVPPAPVDAGEVDGDIVAVGLPPVPPRRPDLPEQAQRPALPVPPQRPVDPAPLTVVETGVDDGDTVAVGRPPVPAAAPDVGQVDGATVAVGQPPVPSTSAETGVDDGAVVAVGSPPAPHVADQPAATPAQRQVPAIDVVAITPAMVRSTADAAFDAIGAWF